MAALIWASFLLFDELDDEFDPVWLYTESSLVLDCCEAAILLVHPQHGTLLAYPSFSWPQFASGSNRQIWSDQYQTSVKRTTTFHFSFRPHGPHTLVRDHGYFHTCKQNGQRRVQMGSAD